MSEIPKKIHLCWKNSDLLDNTHEFVARCMGSLAQHNPQWRIHVSTDADVDQYLKDHLDTIDYLLIKHTHIVAKSDVWRLLKIYLEGGIYVDIDRLCNVQLDKVIYSTTKWVLPSCGDHDFSHDFMCCAPGNPLYLRVLEQNLKLRHQGVDHIYLLGPQTYFHVITAHLMGKPLLTAPTEQDWKIMREEIRARDFMQTYVEHLPYNTFLFRSVENPDFDYESLKKEFYQENQVSHWTGAW